MRQQVGLGDKRAGNGDAHAHAAGKLAREFPRLAGEADAGERVGGATLAFGARDASEVERQPHVGGRPRPRHQRRVLEHEGEACPLRRRPKGRHARPSGRSSPATRRSSVLLPHPDGPITETNSPGVTARSTGASARVPSSKIFSAAAISMAGGEV